MTNHRIPSKVLHITLWVSQIALAAFFVMGAILKFQSIEKSSAMMPWMGQVPALYVRLLGLIDLLGAAGLILPSLLRFKPQVTAWAALFVIALMLCAIVFHLRRGEASVIGLNIIVAVIAAFVFWGRLQMAPIPPK